MSLPQRFSFAAIFFVFSLQAVHAGPLQDAIQGQDPERIRKQIEAGAPDEAPEGSTGAMHLAAATGDTGILRLLQRSGFSTLKRDENGFLPVQVAINHGHDEALQYLLSLMAEPESRFSGQQYFSDPLLEYWNLLFWADQKDRLLESVEAHLALPTGNPLAARIWVAVHDNRNDLAEAFAELEAPWKNRLEVTARVELLLNEQRHREMLEQFPPDHAFSEYDVFALTQLAFSADEFLDTGLKFDYLEAGARLNPSFWQFAWMYGDINVLNNPKYRQRAARFADAPEMDGSLFQDYLRELLGFHVWSEADRWRASERWLAASPGDPRALASAEFAAANSHDHERSLLYGQSALLQFPYYSNRERVARALLKLGRGEQAEAYSRLMARWYSHPDSHEPVEARALRYFAEARQNAGDKGGAREVLEAARSRWPDQYDLLDALAGLEVADGRYHEAAGLMRKVLALKPDPDSGDYRRLVDATSKGGDPSGALALIDEVLGSGVFIDEELYISLLQLARDLERDDLVDEVYAAALQDLPLSRGLKRFQAEHLWSQGDKQKALVLVEELIEQRPTDTSYSDLWKNYAEESPDRDEFLNAVRKKTALYPYAVNWWEMAAAAASGKEAVLATWAEAVEGESSALLGCNGRSGYLIRNKSFDEAEQTIRECLDRFPDDSPDASKGERQSLLLQLFWLMEQRSAQERLGEEFLADVGRQLERYYEDKGNRLNYYRYLEALHRASGNEAAAARALAEKGRLDPDSRTIYHDLVARYSGELTKLEVQGFGYRMLRRNPYSTSHLDGYVHKQVLWGGSAINALKAIEQAKKRGVTYNRRYEQRALNVLGDTLKRFENYRVYGEVPGPSERYVNWFHSARNEALGGERKQILYDFADGRSAVRILLPNGEMAYREDHPVFGVLTKLQKGAAFVEAAYDDVGNLVRLSDSSGRSVELFYNARYKIERMVDAERTLEFEYNDLGKPVYIGIVGLGALRVEYDPYGEIVQVHSDEGNEMALEVSQAFQGLLGLLNAVRDASFNQLPLLPGNDGTLVTLREAYQREAAGSPQAAQAGLDLAQHLVENVTAGAGYFDEASRLLADVYRQAADSGNPEDVRRAVRAIDLWHRVHKQVKPLGLPPEDYSLWAEMQAWLASISGLHKDYRAVHARLDGDRFELMKDAHWLARSELANTGYWKRYGNEELLPPALKTAAKQALLVRANGDVVLGTDKGLAVLRDGFWMHLALDPRLGRFGLEAPQDSIDADSNILSLAETADGALWLGSARGLHRLAGDYDGELESWRTREQGFASPRVNDLHALGNTVYVATADGIGRIRAADAALTILGQGNVTKLAVLPAAELQALVALSDGQLQLLAGGSHSVLASDVQSFVLDGRKVHFISQGRIYVAPLPDGEITGLAADSLRPRLIGQQGDLLLSREVRELTTWDVPGEGALLVVNTDAGINVYKDHYFQSMQLPFELGRGGLASAPLLSGNGPDGDIVVAAEDGVYAFQPSRVRHFDTGRVYDAAVDDELGITYIATSRDILYVDSSGDEPQVGYFAPVNATVLRLDSAGNLVANDGMRIVRFARGSEYAEDLFSAHQGVDDDWRGEVTDILVDSEDTVWVTAGSSVFRYARGMQEPEEYNYFIDPEIFPARSQMLYRVHQTLEGKVQVIASNEGHLSHNGVALEGGVLEWRDGRWENLGRDGRWFATAYTAVGPDTAIVSTETEFAREKNGIRESFVGLNDPSYQEMKDKSSMIWLGGRGARLAPDSDTWLFPTAGGVTVYHNGAWFYPDRLNQLLPEDQALGLYGARSVHSVAVDRAGFVYAGTDLGLLVYRSSGVASLLNDNHRGQVAFVDMDTRHQQEMRDVFLSRIDPESEQGRLIGKYRKLEAEIESMEVSLAGPNGAGADAAATGEDATTTDPGSAEGEALKQKLRQRERERQKLLASLERRHYGLYQMLSMDPREIGAMHEQLSEQQALVQYLPARDKLLIQVVSNGGAVIRQVDVQQDELEMRSRQFSALLRQEASRLAPGSEDRGVPLVGGVLENMELGEDASLQLGAWLYHRLIRPVENDLAGKDQVFITPAGALTTIPFSALVRAVEPRVEYAVERYNFGVLPSMYHFNLVMQHEASLSDSGLFVADPDGTLAGAREEVSQITREYAYETEVLEGPEATIDALQASMHDQRIIHFATHGVLDPEAPEDSYLLLADGYRFNVIDISMQDLEETDLVVLSACESGIGSEGLEYATLARAFAHARVPSVVASFWQVNDEATSALMRYFYAELQTGEQDNFSALGRAKRKMLAADGSLSHPSAWSGFEVFGKP